MVFFSKYFFGSKILRDVISAFLYASESANFLASTLPNGLFRMNHPIISMMKPIKIRMIEESKMPV